MVFVIILCSILTLVIALSISYKKGKCSDLSLKLHDFLLIAEQYITVYCDMHVNDSITTILSNAMVNMDVGIFFVLDVTALCILSVVI